MDIVIFTFNILYLFYSIREVILWGIKFKYFYCITCKKYIQNIKDLNINCDFVKILYIQRMDLIFEFIVHKFYAKIFY